MTCAKKYWEVNLEVDRNYQLLPVIHVQSTHTLLTFIANGILGENVVIIKRHRHEKCYRAKLFISMRNIGHQLHLDDEYMPSKRHICELCKCRTAHILIFMLTSEL